MARRFDRRVARGSYETVHGSSQELAALLRVADVKPRRVSKDEQRRQADAAVADALARGLEIKRIPTRKPR